MRVRIRQFFIIAAAGVVFAIGAFLLFAGRETVALANPGLRKSIDASATLRATATEGLPLVVTGAHTFLQIGRAIVTPYAECRSNHEVQSALAKRLGATHPGFEMTAPEIIEHTLKASGLPSPDRFEEGVWHDCWPGFETSHFLDGFAHKDRKFHFRADWAAFGPQHAKLPAFPDHVAAIDDGDPARPFRLVPAPSRSFLNTSFNNTPSSLAREGRPTAMIHPQALAALGMADGDRVRIGNDQGSVVVHARSFEGMQPRIIIVEGLWPNHAFEEGIGINLLTSADPGLPGGGAVFHDTSVWLKPA